MRRLPISVALGLACILAGVGCRSLSVPSEAEETSASKFEYRITPPEPIHTVKIIRPPDGSFERNLVRIAESVYPSREDLSAVYEKEKKGDMPDEGDVWWYTCDSADFSWKKSGSDDLINTGYEILIPYCITAAAVNYYEALVKAWKQIPQDSPGAWLCGKLDYVATVKRCDDIEDTEVYVVEMKLQWSCYGRLLGSVDFEKNRAVLITGDGKVVGIAGDGRTPYFGAN